MKNLLQNKILLILGVFVLCFSSICVTSVNAATSYTVADVPSNIINDLKNCNHDYENHLALFEKSDGSLILVATSSDLIYNEKFYITSNGSRIYYYILGFDSNFSGGSNLSASYTTNNFILNDFSFMEDTTIVSTNYDIYNSSGELFFPLPPQVIPQVATMEMTQVEELPRAIIQIVKIILPVFLAIFGILLVLYLIKSKNLLNL